jgi:hypothetical protein
VEGVLSSGLELGDSLVAVEVLGNVVDPNELDATDAHASQAVLSMDRRALRVDRK